MVGPTPMIFGMRLKATTFNSLSLTNPPVSEELQMRNWYTNNKEEIQLLLDQHSFNNPAMLLPYPAEETIIPVATTAASIKTLRAWIKGKITFPVQERSYWYSACGNCHKSLDADLTWKVTCPYSLSEIRPMARLTIGINDGSGSIITTMSTPEIEDFIPFTAVQLKESEEFGIDVYDKIGESIRSNTIVAFIRLFETTFCGEADLKTGVVKAYKSVAPNFLTPNKASSFSGHDATNPVTRSSEFSAHTPPKRDASPQVTFSSPSKKGKVGEACST